MESTTSTWQSTNSNTESSTIPSTISTTVGYTDSTTQTQVTDSSTITPTTGGTDSTTSPTISTTDLSTTALTESTTSVTDGTTPPPGSTMEPCPIGELEGDQIALVCPTGFRRHPKYCNLFYQCTKEDNSHDYKILVLSCPNGLIYDNDKIQCLPQNQTQTCNGQIASGTLYRKLNDNSLPPVSFSCIKY